jgi:hypothetical protein
MGILLAILKILGIILLVILGLVLLILLLILFVPICYRIKAVHNENETTADVKVSYLVVKAKAHFDKINKLDYGAWILFFKIFPKKEKEKKDEDIIPGDVMDGDFIDDNIMEESGAGDSGQSDVTQNDSIKPDSDKESDKKSKDSKKESSKEKEKKAGKGLFVKKDKKEKVEAIEEGGEPGELEGSRKKNKKEKKSLGQIYEDISDKADEAMDKVEDGLDKLDQKYVDTVKKIDHVDQFLDRDYVQRTITRALKVIKRLLLTIKPKKSKGYLRLGLGSAADTGSMLGKISMFYGLYGSWLNIEPDFYNKVIEADIDFRGRIYLFRVIFPALRILISRDFWKTKKLAEKI